MSDNLSTSATSTAQKRNNPEDGANIDCKMQHRLASSGNSGNPADIFKTAHSCVHAPLPLPIFHFPHLKTTQQV